MNRHHRWNIFTKEYAEQLDRVLSSMELEGDFYRFFHFMSNDPTTFSKGTDFETIHKLRQDKNTDELVEYLNTLFNMQINYVSNNKPILTTASGIVENSAIGLVGGAGIP